MTQPAPDWGIDVVCSDDIDPTFALESGTVLVAHALYRRFLTPRGTLVGDDDYGLDLRDEVGDSFDTRSVGVLRAKIVAECMKDERVQSATADVSFAAGAIRVSIRGHSAAGPFSLTLAVDTVTAQLLEVA